MRRKDREMSGEFGIKIIDQSNYGVLSIIDENNESYGVPLSIARDENTLYFHSAMNGKKVKIFETEPSVSVTFVGGLKTPEIYKKEELDEIMKDESNAALLVSSVFTTEFQSAIIKGKVKLIQNEEEKVKAMRIICEKYTPTKMDYFHMAIKSGLMRTNVYKIEIEEITAKRKKYDIHGEEMKWGRME